MITGCNFCSRLDGFFQEILCLTRTLSFDTVVFRVGWEFMQLSCNCRPGLGLAAVLKYGSGFLVQWHSLISRADGCSRPVMALLRSCALRIRTEIGRKPEINMAHVNSSHSEKIRFLIDSPGKVQMLISWSVSKERRRLIYLFFHLARSTHLPHKTAVLLRGTSPPAKPTQTEAAQRMKMPLFPRLHSQSSSVTVSQQDVLVFFACVSTVYEVERFQAGRNSLPLSIHLSADSP
jgi:hypothetical protein